MTTPRRLTDPITAFRIGDPSGSYPVFSAEGARRFPGRWNEAGAEVIYASVHYSTAMLEKLVHWTGIMPPDQHFIEIMIPAGTCYEVFSTEHHPNWHQASGESARRFGRAWYAECRSAVLLVPSVVARMEQNIVINTAHDDFHRITVGLERRIWWDARLFD